MTLAKASFVSRFARRLLVGIALLSVGQSARTAAAETGTGHSEACAEQPSDDEPAASDEEDETEEPSEEGGEEETLVESEHAPAEGRVSLSHEAADQAVRAEIAKGKLAFCTEPGHRLSKRDQRLCKLADAASVRCPEFRAACARIAQGPEPPREVRVRKSRAETARSSPFGDMSGVARVVLWVLVGFGVVLLIAVVARNLIKSKDKPETPPDEELGKALSEMPELRQPLETDAERLLARARARAAQGNYALALSDAYAALLRHFDQHGLVELHSARTNGDYVRALREHPELQQTLRGTVRDVERVQFGSTAPTAELFESVLSRVVPIVARSAALLISIGFLLSSTACNQFDEETGAGELGAWSHSPRGLALLRELVHAEGSVLTNRVRSLEHIEPEVDAIIMLDLMIEPVERASLWGFVERGGLLVVAAGIDRLERRIGARQQIAIDCKGELVLEPSYRESYLFGRNAALRTTPYRALEPSNDESWVVARCGGKPYVLGGEVGQGTLLVLPNSDLLSNASMVTADNAFFVLGLLGDARHIEVVGNWTGAGSTTPFAAISNTKLTPLVAQLVVLLLVLFLWRGARFGAPRDPPERSRRAFEEHVRALGLVYARARATRLALANYSAWALDRLRERLQPGMNPSLHGLADAIAARTGRAQGAVMRVLVEARSARDDPARDISTPDDLQTMRDLDRLIAELQLGRR